MSDLFLALSHTNIFANTSREVATSCLPSPIILISSVSWTSVMSCGKMITNCYRLNLDKRWRVENSEGRLLAFQLKANHLWGSVLTGMEEKHLPEQLLDIRYQVC